MKKVLVGLSGGVDSAVAAFLLAEQGYQVIPGFMKNYAEPDNPHCQTRLDRDSAREVCKHLGLGELQIFDFREEYTRRIIDYIYREYTQGRTPNPDVLCNSLVKFDLFAEKARELGCEYVATGHYARVEHQGSMSSLWRGVDYSKDQSYFLSQLSQEQLAYALFPLGGLMKEEVRAIARRIGLPNAERPDSQGLCFIGDVPIKEFLSQQYPKKTGEVINMHGDVVGTHDGAYFYTRGQRHGFQTPMRAYVVSLDVATNTIVVTDDRNDDALWTSRFAISNRHRIGKHHPLPYSPSVKIRYRQPHPVDATLSLVGDQLNCDLSEPQRALASGQFVVGYDGDKVVGSGVIELDV